MTYDVPHDFNFSQTFKNSFNKQKDAENNQISRIVQIRDDESLASWERQKFHPSCMLMFLILQLCSASHNVLRVACV